jgi:hypothetical protein
MRENCGNFAGTSAIYKAVIPSPAMVFGFKDSQIRKRDFCAA